MAVSESRQLAASRLAYVDFDSYFKEAHDEGRELTLGEAVQLLRINGKLVDPKTGDVDGNIKNYVNADGTFKNGFEDIANWKIVASCDCNSKSGYVGMIFDTGSDHILANRGSESMSSISNWIRDWYKADIGLVKSTQTDQEAALESFMEDNHALLDKKPWVSTGHSLGGALADHAAVYSAEAKTKFKNYSGTMNFDGPGHSKNYIKKHEDAINVVSDKMIHYKASIVGNMLYDFSDASLNIATTANDSNNLSFNGILDKFLENIGGEHSIDTWKCDGNGNLIVGSQMPQEMFLESTITVITQLADMLPEDVANHYMQTVYYVGGLIIGGFIDKTVDSEEMKAFALEALLHIVKNPVGFTIEVAGTLVVAVGILAVNLISTALDVILDTLSSWVAELCNKVGEAVSYLKDKVSELFDFVNDFIGELKQRFRDKFNRGVSYVRNNSYFKADTAKLREYAARLDHVNNRLRNLDSGMRSLYWQVGFLDLWDILCSNALTSQSYSIGRAKNYLYNTADRLENVENKAKNYVGG